MTRKSPSLFATFIPWIASTFVPTWSMPRWAVTSVFSNVVACVSSREAVAAEFHCGVAGSFDEATCWPLR